MSAQLHNPTDSLLYLQECLNDLQNRFYGLQLEQLQKHHQHAALEQAAHGTHQNGNIQNQFTESNKQKLVRVPSLSNSIWSHNPHRPPSTSSATTTSSNSSTSDRDSTSSSISSLRSFSPTSSLSPSSSVSQAGLSSGGLSQEAHGGLGLHQVPATSIPTEIAAANAFNASAAAAASLEQFWNPSNIGLQYLTSQTSQLVQNEIQKQQQQRARQEQQEQQKQLYISGGSKKGKIAPIGHLKRC
jgi:hypothetical protein